MLLSSLFSRIVIKIRDVRDTPFAEETEEGEEALWKAERSAKHRGPFALYQRNTILFPTIATSEPRSESRGCNTRDSPHSIRKASGENEEVSEGARGCTVCDRAREDTVLHKGRWSKGERPVVVAERR